MSVIGRDEFLFYRDKAGKWRWSLTAANHRIVAASSQGFRTKWGAKRNARRSGFTP